MQPNDKNPAYLWDMLQAAKEVESMLDNYDQPAFLDDQVMIRALERCLEIIGEAGRRVTDSYRGSHPEIPWKEIIGQRNILAHEYGQIDYELLYKTGTEDIPTLIAIIEEILPPLDS